MNAHQEKIISLQAEIDQLMKWSIDKYGYEIRIPKAGKKKQVEALQLRLKQAIDANEAYSRAVLLLR